MSDTAQTAHKARAAGYGGAFTTFILWLFGPSILGVERPPVDEFVDALRLIVEAIVALASGYILPAVMAYVRRNFPKDGAMMPPHAVFLAVFILLAACAGDRGAPLGDRDDRCAFYETAYLALAVGRDSHNPDQAARLRAYEVFLMQLCGGLPAEGSLQS